MAHRRVQKFCDSIKDKNLKLAIINYIAKLEDYPLTLEKWIRKNSGLERTFRVRVGKYRIIFFVDNAEKTIYVTHTKERKARVELLYKQKKNYPKSIGLVCSLCGKQFESP